MTRQAISTGTNANDRTGDTLRSAANKINDNFVELYQFLSNDDSDNLPTRISLNDSAVVFNNGVFDTVLEHAGSSTNRTITLPNASGNVVIDTATQTLTNKTLTSPSITTPSITTSINDTNGNESIKLTATGSAVNEITIANAATTGAPLISATGTDTNINLSLVSKGTGAVNIDKVSFSQVTQATNGAADATATYIICNKSSALAITLADGTTVGEYKIFTNRNGGTATITPTSFAQGTSFALDQYDAATVIWDGLKWYITGHYGATVS